MMKKKSKHSGEPPAGRQSADYVVGQVSGSLLQQNSAASGSLSALFSSIRPGAAPLFQSAPKPAEQTTEREALQEEVKHELRQKKKKPTRKSSEADRKLQNREGGLQEADEEEEGQKHSAKKKRKSSEMGREKDTEHWVMKRQRLKAQKHEEALKNKRTVFVGNLPISCSEKTLRELFRGGGAIESVRFRSVVREDPTMTRKVAVIKRRVHPQRQSLNAYVVFKDPQDVAKALERNGTEIEKDFLIRVDRVGAGSAHDHKRSVFVGNLSFEMKEFVFRRHFEKCGAIEGVRLVRDKSSGLGKGFGYVLFKSADSVQLALELDGSKLEGRSIRVKRSMKKEKQKKALVKGAPQEKRCGRGGFRSPKRPSGNQKSKSHGSFKGEVAAPNKKTSKKKGLKKREKVSRAVHL
nr:RNA-binding protein 34 [Nothobranchius furzeri]